MSMSLPHAEHRTLQFDGGQAVGSTYQWPGGQYCAIHTVNGLVGCGIYDIRSANEFSLLEVSHAAAALGVTPGMTGREAVERLLVAK